MTAPEDQNRSIDLFKQGPALLENALLGLGESELDYTPSNGGWTIRQIIHHIVDGDDIWKTFVKIALGGQQAEVNLKWYLTQPQTEWAKMWNYESRSIDVSLALFKANRNHVIQLLENSPGAWTKAVKYIEPNGDIELVPIGFSIQMQADHVVHHVKRIQEIREEILNK